MNRNANINIDHAIVTAGETPSGYNYSSPIGDTPNWGRGGQTFYNKFFSIVEQTPIGTAQRSMVRPSDVGRRFCQRVAYNPTASHNNAWGHANWACVDVPYSYLLTPAVATGSSYITEGSTSYSGISGAVTSSGGGTDSRPAQYTVTRFVTRSGAVSGLLTGNWHNVSDVCAIVNGYPGMRDCKKLTQGTKVFQGGRSEAVAAGLTDSLEGVTLTNKDLLCYMTTVNHYSHQVGHRDYAYAIKCVHVAKQPKVQVWGGDVRTNGRVITSRTDMIDGGMTRSYGSWAEYGIIANGSVQSASGAGLSSGSTGRSSVDATRLTFANTGVATPGNFTHQPLSMVVQVPPVPATNLVPLSGARPVAHLQGGYTATNLRLEGGELPAGRRIVIRASGTVTIAGDIRYTAAQLNDMKDIPQLVIVAKHIVVEPQVQRIDAWLLTTHNGSISTCGAASGNQPAQGIDVVACNKQLRINGPVHTDRLYLRRTYGAEDKSPLHLGTPAEIFNLRPDAYLWGHGAAFTTGAIRTMHVKELPPRL
ncbi:MAG: hypothetical protein Q4A37_02770 [Candidatus Saccharibacteria bacterium]|nr:hypothetical protein [Candidatus Saccharibacteria bacterium]